MNQTISILVSASVTINAEFFTYPDGCVGLKRIYQSLEDSILPETNHYPVIYWQYHNGDDFIRLALLVDLIKNLNTHDVTELSEELQITRSLLPVSFDQYALRIDFMPYARQDRLSMHDYTNSTFSLRVIAGLINQLGFSKVFLIDPHSTVTPALVHNSVTVFSRHHLYHKLPDYGDNTILIAPDLGAGKITHEIAAHRDYPVVTMLKKRDPATGRLEVVGGVDIEKIKPDSTLVVIDDICDGGATFIMLMEYLKRKLDLTHNRKVLAVTHGLFSKGTETLSQYYDEIYHYRNGHLINAV